MQHSAEAGGTLGYGLHKSYGALHGKKKDHCILVSGFISTAVYSQEYLKGANSQLGECCLSTYVISNGGYEMIGSKAESKKIKLQSRMDSYLKMFLHENSHPLKLNWRKN